MLVEKLPLTPLQQGMLAYSIGAPGAGMYIVQPIIQFTDICIKSLEYAINIVANKHEILRSSIDNESATATLVIHKEVECKIKEIDWSEESSEFKRKIKLREFLREDRAIPFNLKEAPLIRPTVIKVTKETSLLILTHHHLLLDGTSSPIIAQEITSIYQARKNGISLPHLPDRKPFSEYIKWLEKRDKNADKKYWKKYLEGIDESGSLPCEVRTPNLSLPAQFNKWKAQFDRELISDLEKLALKLNVTISTLFISAIALASARYGSSRDLLIGLLLNGRPYELEGAEKMVGMFMNTLPMRTKIKEDESLTDFVQNIHIDQLEIIENQFISINEIREICQLSNQTELIRCILDNKMYLTNETSSIPNKERKDRDFQKNEETSMATQSVPLHYNLESNKDGVELTVTYDQRLFDSEQIVSFTEFIKLLMNEYSKTNTVNINEYLSLLSAADKEKNIRASETYNIDIKDTTLVHDLFYEQAKKTPLNIALVQENKKYNYQEVSSKSQELLELLRKIGVDQNSVVVLAVTRSPELIFLVLSLLELGATFVPIDETAPEERIKYIIEDANSTHFISTKKINIKSEVNNLTLDEIYSKSVERSETAANRYSFHNKHTAYILYTSGSTGNPKGIRISHQVLVSRLVSDQFPIEETESLISKTSCSFVDFYWELFYSLMHGAKCILLAEKESKNPQSLLKNLQDKSIRRIVLVPSLLSLLLEEYESKPREISNVELWFSTGEPLTPDLAIRFYKLLPNARLFNLYGASEVWDISLAEVPNNLTKNERITAGQAMPNTSIYILDSFKHPVPFGLTGDIYVSGKHLAEGYQRQENNKNSFETTTLYGEEKRLWKTGDRGYFTKHGGLVVQGRNDTLIKLRGFRIDINEIEITAKSHATVLDCAVSTVNQDTLMIAILQEKENIEEVRDYLRSKLPKYMVPSIWKVFDKFPYLSSGKIDRKKLEGIVKEAGQNVSETKDDMLMTSTEKIILKYAKKYLSSSSVDINSNFFESGGHSLLAVRLLSSVSSELDKQIPLETIFSNPKLKDLSTSIDNILDDGSSKLEHLSSYDELSPLSLPQKRLWIVDSLAPGIDTYIISNIISVASLLKKDKLTSALIRLQERHTSLRTKFVVQDGEPYQVIGDQTKDPEIQVSDHDGNEPASELLATMNSHRPKWNLSSGPLFYVYLCQGNGCSAIGLKIHHIISDGVSVRIFFSELLTIYENIEKNNEWSSGLSDLSLDYRDYAIWQHDWSLSSEFESSLQFWREKFSDRPLTCSFFKSSNKTNLDPKIAISTTRTVGSRITNRLRAIATESKTSMFNLLITIYSIFLSRHINDNRISIGTPITGRTNEKLNNLIGFFVDLLVYPFDIDEERTLNSALQATNDLSRDLLKHSDVPFDQIVKHVAPDRDDLGQPLFQAMIVHEISSHAGGSNTTRSTHTYSSSDHANYDYLLLVRESNDSLEITHHVRASVFAPAVLQAMTHRFNTLLSRLGSQPNKRIADISMLPAREFNRVALNWNNTSRQNPYKSNTLVSRFLQLEKEDPYSPCIIDDEATWTRNDIVKLTKHYISILHKHDTSTSNHICICVPKSAHQISIVLAISSLGLSFVPIDPNAPIARKQSIIKASSASLLICDQKTAEQDIEVKQILNINTHSFNSSTTDINDIHDQSKSEEICYVCFTSGSTGTPKGVCVSHFNLISLFHSHSEHFKLTKSSRVLSTLGFYFDAGIGEQTRALLAGSELYFTSKDLLRNPDELLRLLKAYEITHVGIPPSVLQVLDPMYSEQLTKLNVLVTAGEALPASTAEVWGSKRTIITGHGATETTIGDTIAVNWNLKKKPPLGRPLANMKAYILNHSNQICPAYVIGQLAMTGPQVTNGYLNEPQKTKDRFIEEIPLVSSPYKYYLTGDQAYYDRFGVLHFVGRTDYQLKIRGYRIEPGEIEVAACEHPGVSGAVCTAKNDASNRKVLCLYYTTSSSNDDTNLQSYLEEKLPPYMVPTHIIAVETMPTTSNGKVDYKSLPDISEASSVEEIVEPNSETERLMLGIWKAVLKLEKISVNSKFFAIGGDSIQAIQLLSSCKNNGIHLTPTDLYKHQTIRGLSNLIETKCAAK